MKVAASFLIAAVSVVMIGSRSHAVVESLGPNDVSVLFPLPSDTTTDRLFKTTTQATYGELLPYSVFEKIPMIIDFPKRSLEQNYERLRVVALRFDPCFPIANGSQCQAQIRMVWQTVVMSRMVGSDTWAEDGAIHSFYNLSPQEFQTVILKIRELKSKTSVSTASAPLSIHPVLAAEGMESPFAQGLMALVKQYVGSTRLSRVTFMQTLGTGIMWKFGGYEITHSSNELALANLEIPRINYPFQQFVNGTNDNLEFRASISPLPVGSDNFSHLLKDRFKDNRPANDEAQVRLGLESAQRMENPLVHSPETIDCVSCHIAQPFRVWAVSHFENLKGDESQEYRSSFNLTNISENQGNTLFLRSFGYNTMRPATSQRVINETARVLEYLEGK